MSAEQERRQRLIKLASGTAFLALAALIVLVVINQSNTDGGDTNLEGVEETREALAGIPQEGLTLGDPKAKVTLVEFGDLQCPVCKGYAEEILPDVIESQVRGGAAKIEFRNYTIISEESIPAGAAAVAAGQQGRGWDFIELFYRNQGREASGYVTDEFLTEIAKKAGVPDISKWNTARNSRAAVAEVTRTTEEAKRLGLTGTPSLAVEGPGVKGLEVLGTPGSSDALEAAIAAAS